MVPFDIIRPTLFTLRIYRDPSVGTSVVHF